MRAKAKFDGNRLKTDPAFVNSRANMSEFRKAAVAGKYLRRAMASSLGSTADDTLISRLVQVMSQIIKSDPVSLRGERSAMKGNQSLLNKFEFNEKNPLPTVLIPELKSTIDRVSGQTTLAIPAIVPLRDIYQPEGSTHCRIKSVAVAIDFETGAYSTAFAETALIPLNRVELPSVNLVSQLEANSTKVLFHAVGIEFMMITNGVEYPMQNKAYNSLGIVEVNPVV